MLVGKLVEQHTDIEATAAQSHGENATSKGMLQSLQAAQGACRPGVWGD